MVVLKNITAKWWH